MTRREIEGRIARLEAALADVIAGGSGIAHLLEYAKGEGTGYRAYAKAKKTIEALIVKAKAELASLPEESAFEKAKQDFVENGHWNAETKAYIAALEACRPWVIRSKHTGSFAIHSETRSVALFATKEDACHYNERTGSTGWEVVQWEGNQ